MPSTPVIARSNFQDLIHGRSELDPMRVILWLFFGRPSKFKLNNGLQRVIIGANNELDSFFFDTE